MYTIYTFDELSPSQLYAVLALRSAIFVVEQNIVYQDMDGYDDRCLHLCQYESDTLIGYARIVPPGLKYEEPAVGRLVVDQAYRGRKIGGDLLLAGAKEIWKRYGEQTVLIEAQSQLQKYYESLGFTALTEPYMLEGLMHVKMALEPSSVEKLQAG